MPNDLTIDTALAHHQAGRLPQAEAIYRQILRKQPGNPDALHLLGMIAHQTGNHDIGIELIKKAISIDPSSPFYYNNIGGVYRSSNRLDEAIASYRKAISLKPDLAEAHNNLGIIFKEQGKNDEAISCYRKALRYNPEYAEAQWSLTMLQIPPVQQSDADTVSSRAKFSRELSRLNIWFNNRRSIQGWQVVGSHQLFYLAYQEENNRELLSIYGSLCARLMKTWQDSQGFTFPDSTPNEVIRLGIVSAYIQDHSVWNALLKGWYQHIDRSRFELHTFHVGSKYDPETVWAQAQSTTFTHKKSNLNEWVSEILGKKPDILIYPEIGMDPTTIKLASLRLAPVQIAAWGHPETTGLPTMDYYLSAEAFEPLDAQDNYTEQLVSLPGLGCCYQSLPVKAIEPEFKQSGIDLESPILLCPGTPFKYTPRHDAIFVEIAQKLERCQFVFFIHPVAEFSAILRQRLERAFSQAGMNFGDYGLFIPWMERPVFYGLMKHADVFLDTIGFSGFNTAMQAVECGLPLVAWEGRYMRGRLASGILRRMRLEELVADDEVNYVSTVVRLVQNADYRHIVQRRIKEQRHMLFNNPAPVRKLEEFLVGTVAGSGP